MTSIELAVLGRIPAGSAERHKVLAVAVVFVYPVLTVAVGHEDRAVRPEDEDAAVRIGAYIDIPGPIYRRSAMGRTEGLVVRLRREVVGNTGESPFSLREAHEKGNHADCDQRRESISAVAHRCSPR